MLRSRLVAMAIVCACIPFVLAVGHVALACVVLAPAIAALVVGPRIRVERSAEAALGFAALVVGVLAPRVFPFETELAGEFLSERAQLLAAPILVLAGVRAMIAAPTYGVRGTLALALVGLTAAGRAKIGPGYAAVVIAFLLVAATALAANDPTRALPERGRWSHGLRLVLALAAGGVIAGTVGFGIPKLHSAIIDRILRGSRDKSGFSSEMSLGSMSDLEMSDQVVMRVRRTGVDAPDPDYLRGAVFSNYWGNSWHAESETPREYVVGKERPSLEAEPGTTRFELEFVSRPERYFLPLASTDVVASTGDYAENRLGVRWPTSTTRYAKRVWYRPAENGHLVPPTREDRAVPFAHRGPIDELLAGWGVHPDAPAAERLELIRESIARDYTYAIKYARRPGADAVLDFLTQRKEGHCEYFASALALVSRRAGIPARVVAGYRVTERSPIDDYLIVRQRDAHSWVEAWVDGAWVTVDATPEGGFADEKRETNWFSAVFDWLRTSWEKVDDFLASRSPFELTIALVGLVGLLVLIRTLRVRRVRATAVTGNVDATLPAYEELERALAKLGFRRAASETLEAFAARLDVLANGALADGARLAEVPGAIRAYAAHRYGGIDSREALTARLVERVKALTSSSAGRLASPSR